MDQHKDLSMRKANLVRRSRAALSRAEVNSFFNHYEETVAGIPPTIIINADESNLREDPGANKKAIFQRGVKYAEQIRDHSKSCISIMFAGTAAGDFLPPFVVYKAQYCYPAWKKGGPKGSRYTATPSGWFDNYLFVLWMKDILIPYCRRLRGKKLLLVDNLSSHISMEVIELCREHNIEFVCLPPNSTNKMQPLDVGVFGPMKNAWREQLRRYQDQDPEAKLIQKTEFPAMLLELLGALDTKKSLPSAFRKCGLFPINRQEVVDRIPAPVQVQDIADHIDAALLNKLEVRRFGTKKKQPRGKKLPAGKSYTEEDSEDSNVDDVESEGDVESEVDVASGVESEVDVASGVESESKDEVLPDLDEAPTPGPSRMVMKPAGQPEYQPGDLVVAIYEGEWFLCEVCQDQVDAPKGYTRLSYTSIKGKNSFAWNVKNDILMTANDDIIMNKVSPVPINNRGYLGLKAPDLLAVTARMVMVFFLPNEFFVIPFFNLANEKRKNL